MKKGIFVAVAALIILGLLAATGITIYQKIAEKYAESEVKRDLKDYYNVPDGRALLIIDETIALELNGSEKYALYRGGEPYLDIDTVKEMYTTLFMWSTEENRMYYTTASKEYIISPDSKEMLVDDSTEEAEIPPVILEDGNPYISMSFLKNCSSITYKVYEDPVRVLITYSPDEYISVTVKEDSSIRVSQDIKADYLEKLSKGSVVRIIENGGIQQKGFIKVMSEDGVRGYFLKEKLDMDHQKNVTPAINSFEKEQYLHTFLGKKIFLIWHLLYEKGHASEIAEYLEKNPDVNVVSPTWFFMTGSSGNIVSYADKEYVEAAHARNAKVWAVLKNDSDDTFNKKEDTYTVLSHYETRQNLIKNLVNAVKKCGADGINVDIEEISMGTGRYFVQFLRELYLKCSVSGISVSVDNLIPESYNSFYNIPEQTALADYIIVMGYDEHYAGSEAGSVASLPWYKRALDLSLIKCPKEQLIMAIPFYTRLWKEENGKKSSKEIGIGRQNTIIEEKELDAEWLDESGQYYYEYTEDDAHYRIWAEDKKSLALKTVYIGENDVAGTAAWRMGYETEGLWDLVAKAVKGDVVSLTRDTSDEEEETEDLEENLEDQGEIAP